MNKIYDFNFERVNRGPAMKIKLDYQESTSLFIIFQRCISEPHKNMYVSIASKSDTKDLFHNNIQVRVTYYLNALQIIAKYKKQDLVAS